MGRDGRGGDRPGARRDGRFARSSRRRQGGRGDGPGRLVRGTWLDEGADARPAGELYPELLAADYTLERIRPDYAFDETCQRTVPQALAAFFESTSYEDAIRNTISLGGDADTLGAITGAVAGAFYGVPDAFVARARTFLAQDLLDGVDRFEAAIASM